MFSAEEIARAFLNETIRSVRPDTRRNGRSGADAERAALIREDWLSSKCGGRTGRRPRIPAWLNSDARIVAALRKTYPRWSGKFGDSNRWTPRAARLLRAVYLNFRVGIPASEIAFEHRKERRGRYSRKGRERLTKNLQRKLSRFRAIGDSP
jgi:hypothetical protein